MRVGVAGNEPGNDQEEAVMAGERDRTEGAWDKAKGQAKEAAGKVVNDRDLEAEGKRDQVKGGVEKAAGKVKDAAHDVKESVKDATS